MTSASTTVCHDSTCALHHGLPIRVCHVRDQHIAWLHFVHFVDVVHQSNWTCTNFLSNRTTVCEDRAVPLEFVTQFRLAFLLALHCFGTRLQDVEQSVLTVFTPFNVHGPTIVLFDDQCILSKLFHFRICQ